MDTVTISVTEGKKDFTRIVRDSEEKKRKFIVSRRGRPVVIILPYDEYRKSRKAKALNKISEARAAYRSSGLTAQKVYEISRAELEGKS